MKEQKTSPGDFRNSLSVRPSPQTHSFYGKYKGDEHWEWEDLGDSDFCGFSSKSFFFLYIQYLTLHFYGTRGTAQQTHLCQIQPL